METPPPRVVEFMLRFFGSLEDPRIDRTKRHPLVNVVVMALCGAIGGADGWDDLAAFAEARSAWFATFLEMPYGTPSADTFRRVFEMLSPVEFERQFRLWVRALCGALDGQVVAVDGKTLRGAVQDATKDTALHLLHVWAAEQELLLAHSAVPGAPGEIEAIPKLLQLLDLRGAIVTIDANGCTSATTRAIRSAGADFVLCLKGNRAALHRNVAGKFEEAADRRYRGTKSCRTEERAHGRYEQRTVHVMAMKDWPTRVASDWTDVKTIAQVERTRIIDGKSTTERHFYITSLPPNPSVIAQAIRTHWSVENNLHWCLDVGFAEDRRRIRDENAAQNFATITRYALALLKRERSVKHGVPTKRKKAGWDNGYLLRVLSSGIPSV